MSFFLLIKSIFESKASLEAVVARVVALDAYFFSWLMLNGSQTTAHVFILNWNIVALIDGNISIVDAVREVIDGLIDGAVELVDDFGFGCL